MVDAVCPGTLSSGGAHTAGNDCTLVGAHRVAQEREQAPRSRHRSRARNDRRSTRQTLVRLTLFLNRIALDTPTVRTRRNVAVVGRR